MKGMTKGMAAYLQELRNASDKQLQENFEKQTERVAELASQRAQKEEERKAKNEQQSTRAQLAAQGVLGESGVFFFAHFFQPFFSFTLLTQTYIFEIQSMPIQKEDDLENKHGVL